jgi:hypothetical protein
MLRLAKGLSEVHDLHGLCVRLSISALRSQKKARSILLGTLRHLSGRGPNIRAYK